MPQRYGRLRFAEKKSSREGSARDVVYYRDLATIRENLEKSRHYRGVSNEEIVEGQVIGPNYLPESIKIIMQPRLPLSTREAAMLLNVRPHQLRYLVDSGLISPPIMLGRMAWGRTQLERAAEKLDRVFVLRKAFGELVA